LAGILEDGLIEVRLKLQSGYLLRREAKIIEDVASADMRRFGLGEVGIRASASQSAEEVIQRGNSAPEALKRGCFCNDLAARVKLVPFPRSPYSAFLAKAFSHAVPERRNRQACGRGPQLRPLGAYVDLAADAAWLKPMP